MNRIKNLWRKLTNSIIWLTIATHALTIMTLIMERIKVICRRFVISFITNNNTRLKTAWLATIIVLLLNLIIFGFGTSTDPSRSETAQKYYNLYRTGQFVTDGEIVGISGTINETLAWLWSWLRWIAWTGWFALFGFSVIYIPAAFRDEFSRAKQSAWQAVLEKRAGIEEPKEKPVPKAEKAEGAPTTVGSIMPKIAEQARIFTREFGAAVVADVISRRRK